MNYWNKTCSYSEVCVLHWGRMWCVRTEHARRVDYFNVLHTQIFSYLFFSPILSYYLFLSPILSYFLCPGTAVSFFLTAVNFFLYTLTPWILVTAVRLLFFQSCWQLLQSFCPVDICQFLLVPLTAVSFFLFHWFFFCPVNISQLLSVPLAAVSFSLSCSQLSDSSCPIAFSVSCLQLSFLSLLLVSLSFSIPLTDVNFPLSCSQL